jgi:hypothetical protein
MLSSSLLLGISNRYFPRGFPTKILELENEFKTGPEGFHSMGKW